MSIFGQSGKKYIDFTVFTCIQNSLFHICRFNFNGVPVNCSKQILAALGHVYFSHNFGYGNPLFIFQLFRSKVGISFFHGEIAHIGTGEPEALLSLPTGNKINWKCPFPQRRGINTAVSGNGFNLTPFPWETISFPI